MFSPPELLKEKELLVEHEHEQPKPSSAAIIPLTGMGRLVLVRQETELYRTAL